MARSRASHNVIAGRSRRRKRMTELVKDIVLRSRTRNGKVMLPGIDYRGPEMRAYRALREAYQSDIPEPTTSEELMINDIVFLELLIAHDKASFIRRKFKVRSHERRDLLAAIKEQGHLIAKLGTHRRTKEAEDVLRDYLTKPYPHDDAVDAETVDDVQREAAE